MKAKTQTATAASRKKTVAQPSQETLRSILENMLMDIYWAEKHLTKALPKMAKASYNEELKEAFEVHLKQTENQIHRVEDCFVLMGKKAVAKKSEAMEGLVKEGAQAIEDHEEGNARDAVLIAAAQKVEHYEISAYGTMRTMAMVIGLTQCASMLEETKDEEAEMDVNLTELAEKINQLAAQHQIGVGAE